MKTLVLILVSLFYTGCKSGPGHGPLYAIIAFFIGLLLIAFFIRKKQIDKSGASALDLEAPEPLVKILLLPIGIIILPCIFVLLIFLPYRALTALCRFILDKFIPNSSLTHNVDTIVGYMLLFSVIGFCIWHRRNKKKEFSVNEPEELGVDCERDVVGVYEGREDDETVTFGLLKNGVYELYENGESVEEGQWKVTSDKIHITINDPEVGTVLNINQINADGSITEIAEMTDGKREDTPKERQYTYKKIK